MLELKFENEIKISWNQFYMICSHFVLATIKSSENMNFQKFQRIINICQDELFDQKESLYLSEFQKIYE